MIVCRRYFLFIIACILYTSINSLNASSVAVPAPPAIAANAFLLQDFNSGFIIAASDADELLEPASITKLMTAYIVFDALSQGQINLTDKTKISEKAWKNPEFPDWMNGTSRMYVEVGSRVSVEELLSGLIIQSGNDAAVALAEFVSGSELKFVRLMNQYAQKLRLQNTHYSNSTGLPQQDHYSTAQDIARVTIALIRDFPEYYEYFSKKKYTYNNITQNNRNTLLWKDETVDGVKTGMTKGSGFSLVASAERDGMRLVSVVMGAKNNRTRTEFSQKLLSYGFRFFETHKLFDANRVLKEVRIWGGSEDMLKLGLKEDMFITIPSGEYENLQASMDVFDDIKAPVTEFATLGKVRVSLSGNEISDTPLYSLNSIQRGNLIERLSDHVLRLFE